MPDRIGWTRFSQVLTATAHCSRNCSWLTCPQSGGIPEGQRTWPGSTSLRYVLLLRRAATPMPVATRVLGQAWQPGSSRTPRCCSALDRRLAQGAHTVHASTSPRPLPCSQRLCCACPTRWPGWSNSRGLRDRSVLQLALSGQSLSILLRVLSLGNHSTSSPSVVTR